MEDAIHLALITGAIVYCVMVLLSRRQAARLHDLVDSEKRFRELTELSADWFWETDAEHRITWLSGGTPVATLFGTAPTYGKRFWELPGIEVEPRALEAHLERLGRGQPFDLEIARTDERGARQVHIISGRSRLGRDARVLGYRGVGRDVTEQRSAERALWRAKDRLENALDGGNLAEWHLDAVTGALDVGDGWKRFLGHDGTPAVDQLGRLLEAVHPDDAPAAREALVRVVKGELPEYHFEARLPTKQGGWRWLHARGRVTERDAGGRALRLSGTFADIDERKRAEEALREAEQRYRALVELAPDGVIVHSGRVIEYANPAAARILKAASPQRLAGVRLEELLFESDLERFQARMGYLEAGPGVVGFELHGLARVAGGVDGVAGPLEERRKRGMGRRETEDAVCGRPRERLLESDAESGRVAAGHEPDACRGADRGDRVRLGKTGPLGSEPVERRRLVVGASVAAQVAVAKVVRVDQDEVRRCPAPAREPRGRGVGAETESAGTRRSDGKKASAIEWGGGLVGHGALLCSAAQDPGTSRMSRWAPAGQQWTVSEESRRSNAGCEPGNAPEPSGRGGSGAPPEQDGVRCAESPFPVDAAARETNRRAGSLR